MQSAASECFGSAPGRNQSACLTKKRLPGASDGDPRPSALNPGQLSFAGSRTRSGLLFLRQISSIARLTTPWRAWAESRTFFFILKNDVNTTRTPMSAVCASELKGSRTHGSLGRTLKKHCQLSRKPHDLEDVHRPSTESAHRGDVEWLKHDGSLLTRLRAMQVQVQPVRRNYARRPVQRTHCLRKDKRHLLHVGAEWPREPGQAHEANCGSDLQQRGQPRHADRLHEVHRMLGILPDEMELRLRWIAWVQKMVEQVARRDRAPIKSCKIHTPE